RRLDLRRLPQRLRDGVRDVDVVARRLSADEVLRGRVGRVAAEDELACRRTWACDLLCGDGHSLPCGAPARGGSAVPPGTDALRAEHERRERGARRCYAPAVKPTRPPRLWRFTYSTRASTTISRPSSVSSCAEPPSPACKRSSSASASDGATDTDSTVPPSKPRSSRTRSS